MLHTRATLAIGPERESPSWSWIGPDTARELSKYFDVQTFRSDLIPRCDVAVIVKRRPSNVALVDAALKGTRLIYCPVDRYSSEDQIRADAPFLARCQAVLIHCERLRRFIAPLTPSVRFIEHHDRFGLPTPASFKRSSFILWVGGIQYAPYVLRWAEEQRPMPLSLTLLSDWKSARGRSRFDALAQKLGLDVTLTDEHINGHAVVDWSPAAQTHLLSTAKAAIDIKGGADDFNQLTKPPTKAQKYVVSGVPFAVNAESYSFEYFAERGFSLATPTDRDMWFSEEYWRATVEEAQRLRDELSLHAVGLKLKEYVERVLDVRSGV